MSLENLSACREQKGFSWQAFYWANNLKVHWIGYYKTNNWIWNTGALAILADSPAYLNELNLSNALWKAIVKR